jgi:stage V sporulation protein SpoVS
MLFTLRGVAREIVNRKKKKQIGKATKSGNAAGAIKGILLEGKPVCLLAVGPDAVLRAVSAVSLACVYLEKEGFALCFRPEFTAVDLEHEGETTKASALRLHVLIAASAAASATPSQ